MTTFFLLDRDARPENNLNNGRRPSAGAVGGVVTPLAAVMAAEQLNLRSKQQAALSRQSSVDSPRRDQHSKHVRRADSLPGPGYGHINNTTASNCSRSSGDSETGSGRGKRTHKASLMSRPLPCVPATIEEQLTPCSPPPPCPSSTTSSRSRGDAWQALTELSQSVPPPSTEPDIELATTGAQAQPLSEKATLPLGN